MEWRCRCDFKTGLLENPTEECCISLELVGSSVLICGMPHLSKNIMRYFTKKNGCKMDTELY